jgi:hypothetical protein
MAIGVEGDKLHRTEIPLRLRRLTPDRQQRVDQVLPETEPYVNAFRRQWELFLRHVAEELTIPVKSAGRHRWHGAGGVVVVELARAQVD